MSYWNWLGLALLIICSYSGSVACPTGSATIPNCAYCSSSGSTTVCSTCLNGYYLASTNCVLCSSILRNCAYCDYYLGSQLSCKICQTNYGLINGNCLNCSNIIGCLSCRILSPSNTLQCSQCSPGLVLYNESTQCVNCQISNCANCSVAVGNIFQCTFCQAGYFLSANTCVGCATSIPYCASCLYDQNSRLVCAQCANASLYLSNNTCLANCTYAGMPNCAICQIISLSSNSMLCLSCKPNYFLETASRTCQPCTQSIPGCTNCSSQLEPITNVSSTACSACSTGYYLGGANCVNCSSVKMGCNNCSFNFSASLGQCTGCSSGFYLNTTDSTCYSCSSTPYATGSYANNSCSVCAAINATTLSCSFCMSGYYLQNGFCLICSAAISNCSACSGDITNLRCTVCLSGYVMTPSGSCQSCSMLYSNCSICSSVECTDCLTGYYTLDNKKCLPNCLVGNCQICQTKNNSKCVTCNIGYSANGLGTCSIIACTYPLQFNGRTCVCSYNYYLSGGQCLPCSDANCLTCLDNRCTACQNGFYLSGVGGSCIHCISSCQLCMSNTDCLLCLDGYYYSNGGCVLAGVELSGKIGVFYGQNLYQLCSVGCRICISVMICSACHEGFLLNGTICLPCPQNCRACVSTYDNITTSSTINCMACQSGTALMSPASSGCKPCIDFNCLNCDYNVEFCLQCTVTFSSDSAGKCLRCTQNCDFCDQTGHGKCDLSSCSIGFTRVNATSCVKCLSGCASCSSEYPFTCLGCLIGTFNDTTLNICSNCPAECFSCKQYTFCLSCIDGYSLNNNNTCIPNCNLPCTSCKFTQNGSECSGCLQGYALVSGICQPDFSCTSTLICEFCPLNYFAYRGNCFICSNYCRNCKFITSDPAFSIVGLNYLPYLQCTLCSEGYFLQNNTCLACQTGCLMCQGQFNCLNCYQGLFLEYVPVSGQSVMSSSGICRKCLSVCLACDISPNRCTSCQLGFYLSNFRCYSLSNVSYSFTLTSNSNNSSISIFGIVVADLAKVYKDLASAFGPSIINNPYLLTIDSINSGSVIVSGTAGINSSSVDPAVTYTSMISSIQQTSTIGGLTVSSHSMQAQGFTPADSAAETTSNTILFIIIGSSVGALLLMGIIVWLCIRYRKKSNSKQKQKQSQQEEPATSKGMLKSDQGIAKSTVYDPAQKRKIHSPKKRQVSHISSYNSNSPRKNRNQHSSEETDRQRQIQYKSSRRQNGQSNRRNFRRQDEYQKQKRADNSKVDKSKSRRQNDRSKRENDRSKREDYGQQRDNYYDEEGVVSKNRPNHSREKNSKSNGKYFQRPKTSHNIDDQIQRPSVKYRSARDVSPQKPTIQHFRRQSFEDDPPREIEKLQNNSNYSSQKTEKKGSKPGTSVSRKYMPNINSHFI